MLVLDYVDMSPSNSTWGLGGTCLNVGCIPKKLMHTSALHQESIHSMAAFGIQVQQTGFSWEVLVNNIQNYIRSMNFSYKNELRVL